MHLNGRLIFQCDVEEDFDVTLIPKIVENFKTEDFEDFAISE